MDFDALLALASEHKWFAVSALVIGALVRYSKGDLPMPAWMVAQAAKIPSNYRPGVAVGLGVLSGLFESLATGKPLKEAVKHGVASGAAAIWGHLFVVDIARGGKEIGGAAAPKDVQKDQDK